MVTRDNNTDCCLGCFWSTVCNEYRLIKLSKCTYTNKNREECEYFMGYDFFDNCDEKDYEKSLIERNDDYQELIDEMNDNERFYE